MSTECYSPEPRRPRLVWSGRDQRKTAEPLPTQVVEVVFPQQADVKALRDWQEMRTAQGQQSRLPGLRLPEQLGFADGDNRATLLPANRLIWTNDNLVALTALLHGDDQHPPLEGKIDLIYIDPPFAVQTDFRINIEIENGVSDEKLPTLIEELAYTDTWKNGLDSYLSMMRDRLELLKRLLAPTGSIYVHCDWHAAHYIKVLMDEVFGYNRFVNEIVWRRKQSAAWLAKQFGITNDTLLLYSKGDDYTFNPEYSRDDDNTQKYIRQRFVHDDGDGRQYMKSPLVNPLDRPNLRYVFHGVQPPPTGWLYSKVRMDAMHANNELVMPKDGKGRIYRKIYSETYQGQVVQNIWTDIPIVNPMAVERVGFPTQKPVALLQRIIAASSNPGDLVLDAFAGSGTTAVAAETMKDAEGKPASRRWIAIDCGKFAIHISRKRLIEVAARPFAVENVGFYARGRPWRDIFAVQPATKRYRDAMVEIYGGVPVESFAHIHGRKGNRWLHVGPLDAPIANSQIKAILEEASDTELRAVDILSADITIDDNRQALEKQFGIKVYPKIIPAAAVEAVRDRLKRKKRKDAKLEEAPAIHFFSPPDVEVSISVSGDGVAVKLLRLTVDLDDCLQTQDPVKREEIKRKITDWRTLVDYWAVDWDYHPERPFQNDWQSFRTRKQKEIAMQAAHNYGLAQGEKVIAVKVTDIFGNDGLKVARVAVGQGSASVLSTGGAS